MPNYLYLNEKKVPGKLFSKPQSPTKLAKWYNYHFHIERLYVKDSLAFVLGYNEFAIIDVSNPSKPLLKTCYQYTHGEPGEVRCEGNLLYIADNTRGLRIMDISDPASPLYLGSLENYGEINGMTAKDKYLYIGRDCGLQVMDISKPSAPKHLKFVDTEGFLYGVAIKNSYLLVSTYKHLMNKQGNWLQVYNITSPMNPILETEVYLGLWADSNCISIYGNYAYLPGDNEKKRCQAKFILVKKRNESQEVMTSKPIFLFPGVWIH